jgi:hypothetical protein
MLYPLLPITEYFLGLLQKSYARGLPTPFRAGVSELFSFIIAHAKTSCTDQSRRGQKKTLLQRATLRKPKSEEDKVNIGSHVPLPSCRDITRQDCVCHQAN